MAFTVRLRDERGSVAFTDPHRELCALDGETALEALDAAEAALREGYWIAGYLSYELGATLVKGPARDSHGPLLRLGVFDAPLPANEDVRAFSLSPLLPLTDAAAYAAAIEAIHARIYDGAVYQVNYTVEHALRVLGDAASLWSAVADTTGARYQALIEDDDGWVLSWSPELFLEFDGTRLRTRPMKGTAPLDDLAQLESEKNRSEHIMIVDLLRNDLRRICDDANVEALCTIERYPRFATMTSTIAGTVRPNATLRQIVAATFPCGSITGAPKRAAFAAIDALETGPRNVYCGAIGSLSPQRRGWWNVAIRTAQIDRDGYGRFDAGGGIVIDSQAAQEWAEVALKSAFLQRFSEPLVLLETLPSDASDEILEAHLARLRATASRFRLAYDEAPLLAALNEAMERARTRSLVRVRLRGDEIFTIQTEPMPHMEYPVRICLARARVRSDDALLTVKTAWRPAADAAIAQARTQRCFDAILRNERDELTEGSRTNLFVELGGTLYTPPLACGLLPGILRSRIVSEGRVQERVLTPSDLTAADAVYVGNSARGLLPARLVEAS